MTEAAGIGALRRWNAGLGVLHLAQGALMLALGSAFALPVTTSFLELRGGTLEPSLETAFTVRIAPLVAAFLFLSAAAHAVLATVGRRWYERELARRMNRARWVEYAFSSSLMIVVIAMLVGLYDGAALIVLFAVNASMILFGWLVETTGSWTAYWFGCLAGAAPWVAVAIYLAGAADPPGFVYGIYASIFVFFNVFALNMALQRRGVGRWREYLYGERAYMLLSLFAKSALAWQVFAGTLQPA